MEFIREKTKKKPLSKKKLIKRIVIGFVGAFIGLVLVGAMLDLFGPDNDGQILNTETESIDGTEVSEQEIELTPNISLTISDYQSLQNALYEIGANVNTSIVTISTESEENDWMEESYETNWQAAGFIV